MHDFVAAVLALRAWGEAKMRFGMSKMDRLIDIERSALLDVQCPAKKIGVHTASPCNSRVGALISSVIIRNFFRGFGF